MSAPLELYGEDPPEVATPMPDGPGSDSDSGDGGARVGAQDSVEEVGSEPFVEEAEEDDITAGLVLVGIDQRFKELVDRVTRAHRPLTQYLDHARVVRAPAPGEQGGVLEIFFHRDRDARAVRNLSEAAAADMRDALAAIFGEGTTLVVVDVPADPSGATPSIAEATERALAEAQAALEAHAKSHPVVERAVSLFGGEVRRVTR